MDWDEFEHSWLAPYAMRGRDSRGRRYPEPTHPFRTVFQRDRERIVHSTAFRRLIGKTQVLVGQINDHHRTRLTHTLEVAQISRTIARKLKLNEDLTEAIALSHDLGHPPFGHAGEAALAECLDGRGGSTTTSTACVCRCAGERPRLSQLEPVVGAARRSSSTASAEPAGCQSSWPRGAASGKRSWMPATRSLTTPMTDDALGSGLITLDDLDGLNFGGGPRLQSATGTRAKGSFRAAGFASDFPAVLDLIEKTQTQYPPIVTCRVRTCANRLPGSARTDGSEGAAGQFLHRACPRHHRVLRRRRVRVLADVLRLVADGFVAGGICPDGQARRECYAGPDDRRSAEHHWASRGHYLAGMTDRFATGVPPPVPPRRRPVD